jgi:hypothetical protein
MAAVLVSTPSVVDFSRALPPTLLSSLQPNFFSNLLELVVDAVLSGLFGDSDDDLTAPVRRSGEHLMRSLDLFKREHFPDFGRKPAGCN